MDRARHEAIAAVDRCVMSEAACHAGWAVPLSSGVHSEGLRDALCARSGGCSELRRLPFLIVIRRAYPLPPSREHLRAVGRGRGWSGVGGSWKTWGLTDAPPPRRAAFGAAPPSPPLRGGRVGVCGAVSTRSHVAILLRVVASPRASRTRRLGGKLRRRRRMACS